MSHAPQSHHQQAHPQPLQQQQQQQPPGIMPAQRPHMQPPPQQQEPVAEAMWDWFLGPPTSQSQQPWSDAFPGASLVANNWDAAGGGHQHQHQHQRQHHHRPPALGSAMGPAPIGMAQQPPSPAGQHLQHWTAPRGYPQHPPPPPHCFSYASSHSTTPSPTDYAYFAYPPNQPAAQPPAHDAAALDSVAFPPPPLHTLPPHSLPPHLQPASSTFAYPFGSASLTPTTTTPTSTEPCLSAQHAPLMPSKPQKGFFQTHSHSRSLDKDAFPTPIIPSDLPSSDAYSTRQILGKRNASDASFAQLKSSSAKRNRSGSDNALDGRDSDPLPEPEDMPPIADENPGSKPPFSYAELIANAILRAPGRRLTLSGIYKWIGDHFSYYRQSEAAWTNSIRHNLSLNKAFSKRDRPKDDPGKGSYWVIEEGMEKSFLNKRSRRAAGQDTSSDAIRPSSRAGPVTTTPLTRPMSPAESTNAFQTRQSAPQGQPQPLKPEYGQSAPHAPHAHPRRQPDVSSDATMPASDPVIKDDVVDAAHLRSSPPPVNLQSSPPVAARNSPRLPPSRGHDSKKLTADAFRDSGFYSSVESSVPRAGHAHPLLLTSEADLPRGSSHRHSRKRSSRGGRAEEEIARMRGSSFDPSPSKPPKAVFKQPGKPASQLVSSPLRARDRNAALGASGTNPLTPGIKLRPSARVTSTVSPNTHLRRHRQEVYAMIGTPAQARALQALAVPDEFRFSPAATVTQALQPSPVKYPAENAPSPNGALTLLHDFDDVFGKLSPVKNSNLPSPFGATRPGLGRSVTASALNESSRNLRLESPIRMLGHKRSLSPVEPESPSKRARTGSPTTKLDAFDASEFWGNGSSSDLEDDDATAGYDLAKGFVSISNSYSKPPATATGKENAGEAKSRKPSPSARPPLGRASTNLV